MIEGSIVILNDNETYTNLTGCVVKELTLEGMEVLENCNEVCELENGQIVRELRVSALVILYDWIRKNHPDVYKEALAAGVGFELAGV